MSGGDVGGLLVPLFVLKLVPEGDGVLMELDHQKGSWSLWDLFQRGVCVVSDEFSHVSKSYGRTQQ